MVHCFASPSRIKIQWIIEALLPKYSDRIAQDSHLIPFSEYSADNIQHFICSIWNYTSDIISSFCRNVKNPKQKISNLTY